MSLRKIKLIEGEFYHIYNRGVDKRFVFLDKEDLDRFEQGLIEFNVIDPIGSIYKQSFKKNKGEIQLRGKASKLVEIIAYGLVSNHFHLILKQMSEKGIEKFMQRIGTGYTSYFNNKHKRSGSLFQGKFKSSHINKDGQLTGLSAYANLNSFIHQLGGLASKLVRSSWGEYMGEVADDGCICNKKIILDYFDSVDKYKEFALKFVEETVSMRQSEKELAKILLE